MRVEVLHIEDCPNWEDATRRVTAALRATGHDDVTVVAMLLRTPGEAAGVPFSGSPTITVDGIDLFPTEGRTNDLACRIYLTPSGLAGLPTIEQLTAAFESRG
ncbi:hypothetical protein [Glaciibacter superstes]|uniref:hypothetical protein n=1 Tax=Glaciibacter superstes TaxID=501023 RepID=UPI0003B4612E|nr:hypothetical protein [Glaciibacter superstes]